MNASVQTSVCCLPWLTPSPTLCRWTLGGRWPTRTWVWQGGGDERILLPENGDAFAVDLKEHKIRGIGEFGYHSWLIFCRDLGATLRPSDKCLSGYCSWRKKQEAGASSGVKVD